MQRNGIRWTGPVVVTPPTETLPTETVRAVARLRPTEGTTEPRRVASTDDALLDILRGRSVAAYEGWLNRAIYPQTRYVQAVVPAGWFLDEALLEPCASPAVTTARTLADDLTSFDAAGYTFDGRTVCFDPPLTGPMVVRLQYEAGWLTPPEDLTYAIAATVADVFQRRNDAKSRSGVERDRMTAHPEALRYRVGTSAVPLSPVA